MKNKIIKQLLVIVALLLVIYPSVSVQAKVQEFSDINLELTVPDDTIILTADTPLADEKWKEAGITDAKSEKETFEDMGVLAVFYDPNTKTTVRLLQKQSSDSKDIFNLSLLSEEKQKEFFDSLISSSDENTKATVEKYSHPEAVFFRYNVETTQDGVPLRETIYGTIVNGSSLTFDIYTKNSTAAQDESYIKELVAGTHFTKFLDKAEVIKQERDSLIRLGIGFLIIIVIIVILIFINKKRNQKQQILKKRKTEALTKFYAEQRQKEAENIKEPVLFVNRTTYSEAVIKDFCYYNEFIKKYKLWISMTVMVLAVLYLIYNSNFTIMGYIVTGILLFVFIYLQGIRVEKLVNQMMKLYNKDKSMEAIFTFYEEYCTLSGIQYISKYPYSQVSEIKEYKNYIFIYLGADKAIYLNKEGFEHGSEEFLKFIKVHLMN